MYPVAINSSYCSRFFIHTSKVVGEYERASSTELTFPLLRKQGQLIMHQHGKKRSMKGLPYRFSSFNAVALVSANCDIRSKESLKKKRLAVFVSGGGSNFRSIHEAIVTGSIHGDVVVLVTDKPGCGGAKYAVDSNISTICFPKSKNFPEGLSATELVNTLKNLDVDFVLLAGYLKLLPLELLQSFPKAILNIHPSLLPAFGGKGFYGLKVHQAVIASGARYSGPTVHFVDEHYDTGRILAQRVVPVLANDTAEQLAARVLKEEHKLYPMVVAALCEERVIWREDGVPLIEDKENPSILM